MLSRLSWCHFSNFSWFFYVNACQNHSSSSFTTIHTNYLWPIFSVTLASPIVTFHVFLQLPFFQIETKFHITTLFVIIKNTLTQKGPRDSPLRDNIANIVKRETCHTPSNSALKFAILPLDGVRQWHLLYLKKNHA